VRLNPCAADPVDGRHYGPKPWSLQAGNAGIVGLLAAANIAYEWQSELGNPQRQDHSMAVLRDHIQDIHGDWPVHRGLKRLADQLKTGSDVIALLCACEDGQACHRRVVSEALNSIHFEGALRLREIFERK
jgi:hypothetical protein